MKKKICFFVVLFILLIGCNTKSNNKNNIIDSKDSENFYYNLSLNHRKDLKTIKSNGEFLEIELKIEPKNDYKYQDVKIKAILSKEIKSIFVEGINKEFETTSSLTISKNEAYNEGSLSSIFSLDKIDDIKKIEKILEEEGLEVLVTWKYGEEKVLIKK